MSALERPFIISSVLQSIEECSSRLLAAKALSIYTRGKKNSKNQTEHDTKLQIKVGSTCRHSLKGTGYLSVSTPFPARVKCSPPFPQHPAYSQLVQNSGAAGCRRMACSLHPSGCCPGAGQPCQAAFPPGRAAKLHKVPAPIRKPRCHLSPVPLDGNAG